jgi:hypothetical protein
MNVGQQMPITTFCVIANLDDAITEKFAANGIGQQQPSDLSN